MTVQKNNRIGRKGAAKRAAAKLKKIRRTPISATVVQVVDEFVKKNQHKHTYCLSWSEEDKEYVALCAEFPSLSWLAKTPEEALRGIKKLIKQVTEDMINEKQT